MVSETKIARKLDAIFAISIGPTMDSPSLFRWLHAAFDEYLILASRDPDRGIDRVDVEVDDDYPDVAIYRGWWQQTCRVELAIQVLGNNTVSIALSMTKRAADVVSTQWGDSGSEIGNSLLMARLLHVGVCALRGAGILRLTNEPHDARLRAYYSALGFLHGEILALDDRGQLEILFIAIERLYTRFGLDLAAPPP